MVEQDLFPILDGGSIPTSPLQLHIKVIEKKAAEDCYRRWHYFGDKGFLSTYNFGVYFDCRLLGAISYGIPNAPCIKGLYTKETQKKVLELTRFALSDKCPKNSESRVIGITIKIIKKLIPEIKGILTYADTQYNHTGTIYKASNFTYCGITDKKTDLFLNGKPVGKLKGIKYSKLNGYWVDRSQKHRYFYFFNKEDVNLLKYPILKFGLDK